MGLGILAGLALSGPAVQAADYLKATISTQPIYVDGQRVDMTAYSIGGNNYVRLRDIGRAVDVGVTYNAATNSVYIDSTQPYQEEIPPDPLYPEFVGDGLVRVLPHHLLPAGQLGVGGPFTRRVSILPMFPNK